MEIKKDYDLTKLNTFGISARANYFIEINTEVDLVELFSLFEFKENKKIFLGGGSNVLFTKDFDGVVILNKLKGIEILEEGPADVLIRIGSGEVWHDLVSFAVERGYWGLENLAFIPGTVGAAPMQNIGAYGAEFKDILENVETYEIQNLAQSKALGFDVQKRVFSKVECELGYRDSIFKNSLKDKYFISAITLKLSKIPKPNLSYKILKEYLKNNPPVGGEIKKSKDISDAVTAIRRIKLPDPKILGNAGSFFKNIFVDKEKMNELLKAYPEMPFFEEDGVMKVPAGWLVEQCGWKGKRVGNVGVHDRQALVIVNHGGATGEEVKDLAEQIIKDVKEKFGLELVPEVNLI